MKLYAQYVKEMYDREVYFTDHGFVVYNVYEDGSLYIHSIYTNPKHRRNGKAHELEAYLVDKYKPSSIACYVDMTTKNPTLSLKTILAAGYSIVSANETRIILQKGI